MHAGLIDSGEGLKVIAAVLKRLQADKGAAPAKEAWTATGLTLLEYVPKVSLALPRLTHCISRKASKCTWMRMPRLLYTDLKRHPL